MTTFLYKYEKLLFLWQNLPIIFHIEKYSERIILLKLHIERCAKWLKKNPIKKFPK